MSKSLNWIQNHSHKLAFALAALGALAYMLLSVYYAHHMVATMDEGTYLIKGMWYIDGTYRPFQEQGPVTNKLPLSFLVPGLSQVLFEPGLLSGRYFSIFQSLVMLLGLWMTARRFSASPWVATALVWASALNQNWLMYHSRPMSQVTTAMFTSWSLYFLLGRERKAWEVLTGALLAACAVLTRQNMLPFLAAAVLYMLWEHGWKKGGAAALACGLFFLATQAAYWPGVYYIIWGFALPKAVTNLFIAWGWLDPVTRMDGEPLFRNYYELQPVIQEMFGGVRYSLLPVWLTLAGLALYPFRRLSAHPHTKPVIFLLFSYVIVTLGHIWATLSDRTILYSFPSYFAFYNPIGLLLAPFLCQAISTRISKLGAAAISLIVVTLSGGIGMHLYRPLSTFLLNLNVPRIRDFRIEAGSAELWRMIANKFGLEYFEQEPWVTTAAGLLVGLLILLVALLPWLGLRKRGLSYGWTLAALFTALVFALTPTGLLAGGGSTFLCEADSLQAYDEVGESLRAVIPAGSLVYWGSHTQPSPVALLYLPGIRTFPVQLNGDFYFRKGGTTETALRLNYWNEELAERWLLEADFLLLNEKYAAQWAPLLSTAYAGRFEELPQTAPVYPCDQGSYLRVFRAVK
jgi:hypothetical protein